MLDNYPDVLSFRQVMEITHVGRNLLHQQSPYKGPRASIFHLHYLPYRSNELYCKMHLLR